MHLHIRHETVYRYEHAVKHSVQTLRLTPRTETGQRVLSWNLSAPGRQAQQMGVRRGTRHGGSHLRDVLVVGAVVHHQHLQAHASLDPHRFEGALQQ